MEPKLWQVMEAMESWLDVIQKALNVDGILNAPKRKKPKS